MRLYLIRHAAHELLGRVLVGRGPVSLSAEGCRQAERLGAELAGRPLAAVLSSPRERAQETAAPIARQRGLAVAIAEPLDEVDFGEWTGRGFDELEHDPRWQRFNRQRSIAVIPKGETLLAVQERMVRFIEQLRAARAGEELALVSHGDVIRAALLHYLGMPLDFIHRLVVEPASISLLDLGQAEPRVSSIGAAVAPSA